MPPTPTDAHGPLINRLISLSDIGELSIKSGRAASGMLLILTGKEELNLIRKT
jgi:hypothetical protein